MRTAALLAALAVFATDAAADSWTPPIGIPVPEFGIEEAHTMYAGSPGYHTGTDGPYSIYVDNTADNCSDRGPATSAKPRCTIPTHIDQPGTVVEIHGGPYSYNMSKPVIDVNGTAEQPVFLRGVDDGQGFPVIDDASTIAIQGSYFIVENLIFDKSSLRTGSSETSRYGQRHIGLRHLEIRNHPLKNGSGLGGDDVVFYKNHVHHNQGDDRHGTTVARGSNRVWIVDNYFHHNGGDAIQFCHRCKKEPPRNIFVGRNLMHSDRENAVDLKFGKDIVISENTMYGYRAARKGEHWCYDDESYCGTFTSGSDGSAIVVGSDGAPGRPWILANNIFDSSQGIRIEEVRDAWIIGNRVHNIKRNSIALQKWGENLHIIGNVLYDAEFGINQYWRDKFTLHVSGNIVSQMRDHLVYAESQVADRSSFEGNLLWNDGKDVRLRWGRRFKERARGNVSSTEIAGAKNFLGDPSIERIDEQHIRVAAGLETVTICRQRLSEVAATFASIYGNGVSIDTSALCAPNAGPAVGASR